MQRHNIFVVFAVGLICVGVVNCGAQDLVDATAAIDRLWNPVNVLWVNTATVTFQQQINRIMRQFITLDEKIDLLENTPFVGSEFQQFLLYKPPTRNEDLFDIIMKLLYTQSSRQRGDFTSKGGPNLRMYAFGIIGKICNRFGPADDEDANDNRKAYLYPHLHVNDPTEQFYYPIDDVPITGLEEGQLDDDPAEFEGPYVDAIETFEGQLYNFYNQWTNSEGRYINVNPNINTMNAVIQNMLTVLDFIMNADDYFTPTKVPGQGAKDYANFIYFFEINRIVDIIQQIADRPANTVDKQNIKDYANYLMLRYFIEGDEPDAPAARLVTTTYNLGQVKVFKTLRR